MAIDAQKAAIDANTRQFVAGLPANNVLLTGSRGTGKSSLVKAMLGKYAGKGLRLIEVDKSDLVDLPDIVDPIAERPERFIVFCDDLSFDADEPGYKALKVMLDGTIAGSLVERADLRDLEPAASACPNTSARTSRRGTSAKKYTRANRSRKRYRCRSASGCGSRSIRSRRMTTSPRSRSGCASTTCRLPMAAPRLERLHHEAVQFALQRGSRSGRVAWQFARAQAGARAFDAGKGRGRSKSAR